MAPVVVLIGPPGAGKTTVGTELAAALGVEFRDTDHEVESVAGIPVSDIFLERGEAEFRRLEQAAVLSAITDQDGVVAVGGGAVESPDVRQALRGQFVVLLSVGASEAAKRVGIDGARPLLLGNVRTQWSQLLARRAPWYAEVADRTVATGGREVADVVAEIRACLDRQEQQA